MMRAGKIAARIGGAVFALLLVFALTDPGASQAPAGGPSGQMPEMKHKAVEAYGKLPFRFEANRGQTDPQVDFLARGSGYTLYLTGTEAVLVLRQAQGSRPGVLRMKFVGANPAPQVAGLEQLPGTANYFVGSDPRAWRTGIPTYAKVEYRDVYPGVSLVYYGTQGQLEYDFVLAPGADPGTIRVAFEGASSLEVDARGNLVLKTAAGEIRQAKPVIYQEVNGARQEISGGYVLKGRDQVAFEVAAYDASRPLVIDPVLSYSTFLGGSFDDIGYAIAVDNAGNAYVTGLTMSFADFTTTTGAYQTAFGFGNQDAFVTKLNPAAASAAESVVYSTYLGGNSDETGYGIAVDGSGNAYVTGFTFSTNFPITLNSLQPAVGGLSDAFVTKLNAAGGLEYSTYLGGRSFDEGKAIAVDSAGNAYVTGVTESSNGAAGGFPLSTGAFQPVYGGGGDAFVTKVDTRATSPAASLVYSTYLGGTGSEVGLGIDIAEDGSGNAYVTGFTFSTNFPTVNGLPDPPGGRGGSDAFVTKLNPDGSALVYSTYLGGSSGDEGRGIAVDDAANAYVTGFTLSTNFPTVNGLPDPPGGRGGSDAFVTKLNPSGSALLYSTYLGGSDGDLANAIAVHASGNVYVTGRTDTTSGFPLKDPLEADAINGVNSGVSGDAFVTKLNPAASGTASLVFSTYLGGNMTDVGTGIAVDSAGNAYVTGETTSLLDPGAFRTVNGLSACGTSVPDTSCVGPDAFVAKIEIPNPEAPAPQVVPFAAFSLREVELDRDDDEFDRDAFKARFTLGADSNPLTKGIDLLNEDVTIQVGSAAARIPKGSFTKDRKGRFNYEGPVNDGVRVKVSIRPSGGDSFKITFKGYKAEDTHKYRGRRHDYRRGDRHRRHEQRYDHVRGWWSKRRAGTSSDIAVALTIGNDSGGTTWKEKRGHGGSYDRDDYRGGDDRDEQRNGHRGRRR